MEASKQDGDVSAEGAVGKDGETTKTGLKAQSAHDALMGAAACSTGKPDATLQAAAAGGNLKTPRQNMSDDAPMGTPGGNPHVPTAHGSTQSHFDVALVEVAQNCRLSGENPQTVRDARSFVFPRRSTSPRTRASSSASPPCGGIQRLSRGFQSHVLADRCSNLQMNTTWELRAEWPNISSGIESFGSEVRESSKPSYRRGATSLSSGPRAVPMQMLVGPLRFRAMGVLQQCRHGRN